MYGPTDANSLHLLNAYFTEYPEDADKVVLSMKGGIDIPAGYKIDGTEAGARKSVENCLEILDGKKKIDIFKYGRMDPNVPVEETVKALKKLQDEGLIEGIGLTEVRADTIRRAAKVAPIAAVEIEMSLTTRDALTNGVLSACADLEIPVVAYSPLGRGLLTGKYRTEADIQEGGILQDMPRFQGQALSVNVKFADAVAELAKEKGCTPAQLAVAWTISQSSPKSPVIPIPGASTAERVEENMQEVTLTKDDMEDIAEILYKYPVEGLRYSELEMALCDA